MSGQTTVTPIEPDVITTSRTATVLTIRCMSLELFTSATFLATLSDASGGIITTQVIKLTTEQYLAWNNNDAYIIDLVASILGVTPSLPSSASKTN
jgi:hypothetical protein